MDPLIVFFIQFIFGFILLALVVRWYLWPRLRALPANQALAIVLFGGAIRYMGTILLVQGVIPGIQADLMGAFGDVVSATLAVAAIVANHSGSPAGRPLAWTYVVIGGGDLVVTGARGFMSGLFSHLAGAWTFIVLAFPAVVLALVLTVILLVRPQPVVAGAGKLVATPG